MQRTTKALQSIARRERSGNADGFPKTRNGQIGPFAHVEAAAQLAENDGPPVARRLTDPGERGDNHRGVPLPLAIVACLHFERGPAFAVRGGSSFVVGDVREDAVGLPDFRRRSVETIETQHDGQCLLSQMSGVDEAIRLVLQQGSEVAQTVSKLRGISTLTIDLERLSIPPFRRLRTAGLLSEDTQLVPGLSGCGQAATLLADACRLPVVPFGFI